VECDQCFNVDNVHAFPKEKGAIPVSEWLLFFPPK
jgi:hypothetical protein